MVVNYTSKVTNHVPREHLYSTVVTLDDRHMIIKIFFIVQATEDWGKSIFGKVAKTFA